MEASGQPDAGAALVELGLGSSLAAAMISVVGMPLAELGVDISLAIVLSSAAGWGGCVWLEGDSC